MHGILGTMREPAVLRENGGHRRSQLKKGFRPLIVETFLLSIGIFLNSQKGDNIY